MLSAREAEELRDLSPEQRAPEDIAATLMARIGGAIPVLPVPLMASVLVEAETAMTRTEIMDAMRDRAERIAGAGGHLFLPDTGGAGTFAEAFSQLNLREIVEEEDGHYTVQPGKMPILRYYAASLSQVPGAMTRVDAAQKDRSRESHRIGENPSADRRHTVSAVKSRVEPSPQRFLDRRPAFVLLAVSDLDLGRPE